MGLSIRVKTSVNAFVFIACFVTGAIFGSAQQPAGAKTFTQTASEPNRYLVRMLGTAHPRFAVTATLSINGKALEMATTRSGDVPEVGEKGWPALVKNLRVSDEKGRPLAVKGNRARGWLLDQPHAGPLKIDYEVDYSSLASNGWPAPREAAFADATHLMLVGRSLFITSGAVEPSVVMFELPPGWRPVTPWPLIGRSQSAYAVAAAKDLTENLIVLTRAGKDAVSAGGFRVLVTALGQWQEARPEVKQVLRGVLPRLVQLIGFEGHENYSIVLLPPPMDTAAESYRQSFAFTFESTPTRANRVLWGRFIAHEIFHYWNGWRMHGADYASSQWFHEGFTEYAANLTMVTSGVANAHEFRQQLATHIGNYKRLATPLDAPGTRKGPPLYSGGALVALCWDVTIRQATGGKRDLGDFFREFWRQTNGGRRAYDWNDIRTALNKTAAHDWESFYRAHIKGTEPLPLDKILSQVGMRLVQGVDGSPVVELDNAASPKASLLGRALVKGI